MTEATLARRATEIPTETRQELDGTNAEHGEVSYPLSPFAVSVLSRITYDDMKDYELTTSQADLLTTGILRLWDKNNARKNGRNYPALVRALLAPDSTPQQIAQDILQTDNHTNTYNAIQNIVVRCNKVAPKGLSIDTLIELGKPEYQPPVSPRIARNLGTSATELVALLFTPEELHQASSDPLDKSYDEGEPLAWQKDALCAQTDPEAFFPEKGGTTKHAKRICNSCEVRTNCLEYALQNDERFGIWGGLGERERRKLKKERHLP